MCDEGDVEDVGDDENEGSDTCYDNCDNEGESEGVTTGAYVIGGTTQGAHMVITQGRRMMNGGKLGQHHMWVTCEGDGTGRVTTPGDHTWVYDDLDDHA